jgi:hypothetical protein
MAFRPKGWLLAAYCVALLAVCNVLVINGPQIRAAAEAREAHVVEEENRAFCATFGIVPEAARYAECASELTQIRARHLQRYVSDSVL